MSLTKASYSMITGAPVNVLDYGADSTGNTDSTAAFALALAAGYAVYVPTGQYKITGNLVVGDNTYLYGDGPLKSTFKCDTDSFTGVFLSVRGRTLVENIGVEATGAKAGTGIRIFDSGGEYSFTGHVKLRNVYTNGFDKGIDVNNIFDLLLELCESSGNNYGVHIVPSYSVSADSGYVTTVNINKCYIHDNSTYGVYLLPTLVSKNIHFLDTIVEANTGATAQISVTKCNPLLFTNCYQEAVSGAPAISLAECVTFLRGHYFNGTGGLNLGTGSNEITCEDFYGVASTDVIFANGTSLQTVRVLDSSVPGTSTLNASRLQFVNSTVNGTYYRQFSSNLDLTVTDGDLTNTSRVSSIVALKTSITATINANTTAALISDQSLPNTWNSDFTVALANFLDSYNPGLILTVQCASTGSPQYFSVLATNTTGSPITVTSKALRVVFFKGTAMAI